jgi:hypothetical protein
MAHPVSPVVRGTRIALHSDALFPIADIALRKRARSDEMHMPEEDADAYAYASGVAMSPHPAEQPRPPSLRQQQIPQPEGIAVRAELSAGAL